jgi:hypothetical protein
MACLPRVLEEHDLEMVEVTAIGTTKRKAARSEAR